MVRGVMQEERVVIQPEHTREVIVDGQAVRLEFTNTECEVRLVKVAGRWEFCERQIKPLDPTQSWIGTLIFWDREIDRLGGWEPMLLDRLKLHKTITLSQAATRTGCGKSTVRGHFRKLVEQGRARLEPVGKDGDEIQLVAL